MAILSHHGKEPVLHRSVFVAGGAWLIGDVTVGEDSSIWFNVVARGDINTIQIGKRSNIQDGSVLHVTEDCPVRVGDDVTIGHKAMVHGCRIEQGSLIGMGAVVLDNATVGPNALVAAGAVVREKYVVPPGTLVAGVPARVVRELTEEERSLILQSAEHYIEYARSFVA
ncbi:MAG: gamma carbonic anhydrase family protein [Bacteroidetes bacterium]|nr:gamma carbonic anhydrase family protein [Bacteroidota bacterium]